MCDVPFFLVLFVLMFSVQWHRTWGFSSPLCKPAPIISSKALSGVVRTRDREWCFGGHKIVYLHEVILHEEFLLWESGRKNGRAALFVTMDIYLIVSARARSAERL